MGLGISKKINGNPGRRKDILIDLREPPPGTDNLGGQRRDVAFNILRPSVKLLLEMFVEDGEFQQGFKCVDDVIQQLVDPHEVQQLSLSMSDSEISNNIAQRILDLLPFVDIDFESCVFHIHSREKKVSPTSPEHVVRFFDSAIRILQYIGKEFDPTILGNSIKKEIPEALDNLEFLRNLLLLLGKCLTVTENDDDVMWDEFFSAQEIPQTLSFLFFSYSLLLLVNNNNLVTKLSKNFKIGLPLVRKRLHFHVQQLYGINERSRKLPAAQDDMDTPAAAIIIDQEVGAFFDRLINKLRTQSSVPQMETAIHELTFLRVNLLDILQAYSQENSAVKEMESLSFSALAIIIETAFRAYFSTEPDAAYWSSHLPNLIDAIDFIKQQAIDLFKSCRIFSVSSRNPSGSTNLFQSLEELIKHKSASIAPLMQQVETYYQLLVPMRNFLASEIADEQMAANSQMGFFRARFKELAQEFKFMVDSFLAGEGSLLSHKLGMFVITEEVKMIFKKIESVEKKREASKVKMIHNQIMADPCADIKTAISSNDGMKLTKPINKRVRIKLVGVTDAAREAKELLTGGATGLKIISIVGMPGLGKTTLANFLFAHPSVTMKFHVRAWCSVSQVYNREALLADILSQIDCQTNSSILEEVSGDDLAQMVYRKLKGRRYLIVIDDIWDIEAWQELEIIFPDDENKSRILFTTRHHDVARKANSLPYSLRLLSNEESCRLLWLKVFDRQTCPPKLSSISRQIAEKCKGLPLALILVAGILRRTGTSTKSWEQVAARVTSLQEEQGNYSDTLWFTDVLELSYAHLPVRLRPCFLYFAAVPEDSISVSKLIQLWISEGFVREENMGHKSLEEEAESYLEELIDRSLVMIAKTSSSGGVKACLIHHVLRDLCSTISHQSFTLPDTIFGGMMRRYLRSLFYDSIPGHREIVTDVQQIGGFFSDRRELFIEKLPFPRKPGTEGALNKQHRRLDNAFISDHKSLRVLDLGNVRIESSADTRDIITIATLVHLRFLGIRLRTNEIPAQIGNLQKLETLALTGAIGYVILPESFWNLSNLRNVLMDNGFFNFQHCSENFLENFSGLYNLRSVSTLSLRQGDDVGNYILRRLPCVQKLSCRFGYSWDDATGCCVFPALDFLNELQSLKLFFYGMALSPWKFSFPPKLKKLSLSNSRLPWEELSVILKQLPNLEVLKLLNKAFEGRQWDMEDDDEFPKLKFLKLDSLNIQVWNADAKPFPNLEQLVMLRCPELEEIPSFFGEVATLLSIEVKWCSSSAMDSVIQILEAQRDASNHQLKLSLLASAKCLKLIEKSTREFSERSYF